jgi:aromatic-L-amino-acid decarboxylase
MDPEAFRAHGHALVDWLADHMGPVDELPWWRPWRPARSPARLPGRAPEEPEPFADLLRDLDDVVVPGITQWQSPGWFAYFPANTSGPSVLAELVSAGLGAQGMLWATSPAVTEIESRVMDWLVDLLGLPQHFKLVVGPGGGSIQVSASDATHLVHVVARRRAVEAGAATDDVVAYGSSQAHSSVERGARVAGFRHVRLVEVDERQALRPDALAAAITQDAAAGLAPAIVTSAIGTTGTGAVDPVAEVAQLAGRRAVAPRRRGVGGLGHAAARAPGPPGGGRARGLVHVQPAQVAVHELRLQRALRRRPGAAERHAVEPSRPTCATPRRSRGRSWTSATGRSRSGAASAR